MIALKVSHAELDQANLPPIVRAYLRRSVKDGSYESHMSMSGKEIPWHGKVSWILPAGPFEYGQFEITDFDAE